MIAHSWCLTTTYNYVLLSCPYFFCTEYHNIFNHLFFIIVFSDFVSIYFLRVNRWVERFHVCYVLVLCTPRYLSRGCKLPRSQSITARVSIPRNHRPHVKSDAIRAMLLDKVYLRTPSLRGRRSLSLNCAPVFFTLQAHNLVHVNHLKTLLSRY